MKQMNREITKEKYRRKQAQRKKYLQQRLQAIQQERRRREQNNSKKQTNMARYFNLPGTVDREELTVGDPDVSKINQYSIINPC